MALLRSRPKVIVKLHGIMMTTHDTGIAWMENPFEYFTLNLPSCRPVPSTMIHVRFYMFALTWWL